MRPKYSDPVEPKEKSEPERDPVALLHGALRDAVEDIEDALSVRYRIGATIEIADGVESARLIYKRAGDPPHWALFLLFPTLTTVPSRPTTQLESFGSAPLRWRCAAVRSLPALVVELQKEQRAADENLNAAVHAATRFLEELRKDER